MLNDLTGPIYNRPVACVDLSAIVENCRVVRDMAPASRIMAVIKADAYGHGLTPVARAISNEVDALAVARVEEAQTLREYGVTGELVVLQGFVSQAELAVCQSENLVPVVHTDAQLVWLKNTPELRVWLKVDTGMHRLGLAPETLKDVYRRLNVVGVMSHLANSDEPGHRQNREQLRQLISCTAGLNCPLSLANSGAVLSLPDSHLAWVRPGIMLFGACADGTEEGRIRAAMSLTAPIVSVKALRAGDAVGYGSTWTANEPCRIAVVGVGYADGYPREIANAEVLTANGRRPVVGRVSMDMLTILLRADDEMDVGDHVTMWGEGLPVGEVSSWASTVPYTLMTGLTGRVRREYTDS